ncbi:MAG: J domain-containing protein [Deltaproteobacteria bacterium]|nr:J domain-containing protein [Deltaproteobacteria bacterium]MBW2658055.1 J domain-containing protein [Deltaproteobacteria bacterium]
MKDYYKVLLVTRSSTEDEIRRNYRKLAMQYHPDRNPDSREAEKKFKDIAEAYGVLTDPVKRRQYNRLKAKGRDGYSTENSEESFSYSQEDILRDLFKDPRFQGMFRGVLREFQRSGFRSNSKFIQKSLFNGKGGIFLGGIFFFGSLAGPMLSRAARKTTSGNSSLLKSLGSSLGSILGSTEKKSSPATTAGPELRRQLERHDTTYYTPLTADEMRLGKTVQVVVYGKSGEQTLKVKIPPGSRVGRKLRIRGKGQPGPYGRGDLYLNLVLQKSN